MKCLAVKSPQGVIGLRTKKVVKRDSREFDQLVVLAERALYLQTGTHAIQLLQVLSIFILKGENLPRRLLTNPMGQ